MSRTIFVFDVQRLPHAAEEWRLQATRSYAQREPATFVLRNADDTVYLTVDAEAFMRTVSAAWELVKPL